MRVELMDTTLRDGEQTNGVSYNAFEKLSIAKILLEEVKVDRIEIASARVSDGEYEAVKKITDWAKQRKLLDRIEVLGFVDGVKSLDWIHTAGARVVNLLTKGSLKHVKEQLGKTPDEHISDIKKSIEYAQVIGIEVNLYLEDWSNGMRNSRDYVFYLVDNLKDTGYKRLMLPDTLGIMNQEESYDFCKIMLDRYPGLHIDFHAHNDYDLAVANCFAAVRAGVHGLHATVNGLGERAGNVPLSSVIGILNDHLKVENSVDETKLTKISRLVESFSGIRVPSNKPVIGDYVFTQTCGVHADGDSKNDLYFNDLLPERFGRVRKYALGKTSGKANIKKNLEELGLELDPESMKKVTERVIALGDKKKQVTTEDLPYIISDVLGGISNNERPIKISSYALTVSNGLRPMANLCVEINGVCHEESSVGDGQYDAFMKALWKVYGKLGKDRPVLNDYVVTIPPGGKTDALVETVITWSYKDKEFKTKGLEADQTEAAIKATEKMLNIIEKNNL
ncbi:MAG: 2-isopropylmalate synthase [Bacteroidales bacterium]|nr:2-isopropylmalate synthase [Bacteroidales bacterium]